MPRPTPQISELQHRVGLSIPNAIIEAQQLPLVPEIPLFLLAADYPKGPLPRETMLAVLEQPAYWAFCWASGQAMARYLLDQPDWVRGRRVLDFGSGSGIAGIAAAKAGAVAVTACDIDRDARYATALNAELNQCEIEIIDQLDFSLGPYDIVLIADVLYDITNLPLLKALTHLAPELLIADSRVKHIPLLGVEILGAMEASTIPDLDEHPEYRRVQLYHWQRTDDRDGGHRDGGHRDGGHRDNNQQ